MSLAIPSFFDLTGKNALITQGAQGLGWQLARALGEAGARIMLSDRLATDLEVACAELQACGIDARWVAADLHLKVDVHHLVAETLQRMGDIDILVDSTASAGEGLSQRVVHASMMGRRCGRIIQLIRGVDHAHQDEWTRTTRALVALWGPYNIQVNTLCYTDSPTTPGAAWPGDVAALQGLALLLACEVGRSIQGQCLAVPGNVGSSEVST